MPGQVPSRIGRYRVLKVLGPCGPVYLGHDDESGRDVVIKRLHGNLDRDEFERMAQATAGLDHPSVSSFLDLERDGDALFMVVERPKGRVLSDLLRSG